METTLYNHKKIGNKPTIPNIIFKSLIWLYENKFYEECEYLKQHYSLTPDQQQFYEELNKLGRKKV